ncbi:MAG: hypothetical protein WC505_01675 [Patescibacteria group bacterium]
MLETSKDLLFVALATCAVALTFFMCWALYYIVMMLKRAHAVVNEVSELVMSIKQKLERLERLFDAVEDKIKNSASYLPLLFKGITELVEYFKRRREEKPKRKKASEKEKETS